MLNINLDSQSAVKPDSFVFVGLKKSDMGTIYSFNGRIVRDVGGCGKYHVLGIAVSASP